MFEVTHAGVVLLGYQRRHCAADRGFNIDGRIVSGFGQTTRQHNMTVKDRARGVGNRVLLVIAFRQYRIERGDGAAAADAVPRAFHQRREFGEDRRRVAFGRRWLTDGQRDFTLRHRVTGQGIHDQQHVLAAVSKIFGDTGGIRGTLHAQQRRHVCRCGDHHRAGAAFRTQNVFNKVFYFTTTFADQPHDDHVGLGIARHHAEQDGFAYA